MRPEIVASENISASIISKGSDMHFAQICNFTELPIYRVIISVVNVQNKPSDGIDTPAKLRYFYIMVPPGVWHEPITIHNGAGFCSGLELAFTDSKGESWLRNGLGRIKRLQMEAHQYYSLHLPLDWNYVTLR